MKTVDREPLLISKASVRALRKFALEAIRRHPELRKIVPDHDAAFASSLDKAFPAARHAQLPTDLRATLDRALEMPESLPRLWALTDLACALASGFDETGPHAEELAQIGSELAAHVHEHAHIVADDDPELIDANWCDAVLGAWRRGWPWLDELGEALAHAIEPDLELVDHVVAAAVDAAVAADDEHATFRMSSLALRLRVATGQTDLALDLVRRFHLGVTYGEVLAAFGRVPELLVQHAVILEDRQEYATVVTGLALMGYTAEARALGEAGLTWGSGDRDSLEDALAQIPDRYAMAPDPGAVAGGEHAAFESFKVELPADPAGEKFMSPKIINDLLFGDAPAKAGSPVIAAEFATVVTEILAYNLPDLDPHYPEYVIKLMRRGEVAERTISRLLAFVVDGYIARGTRKSYLLARDALRHVRTLCIDTEDSEFWIHTLRRIRATQARKRALQEILAPYYTEAGLT